MLAISRQIASGGASIGEAVSRTLGLRDVDREIVQSAAAVTAVVASKLKARLYGISCECPKSGAQLVVFTRLTNCERERIFDRRNANR